MPWPSPELPGAEGIKRKPCPGLASSPRTPEQSSREEMAGTALRLRVLIPCPLPSAVTKSSPPPGHSRAGDTGGWRGAVPIPLPGCLAGRRDASLANPSENELCFIEG